MNSSQSVRSGALALMLVLSLVACGDKDEKPATQVAVRVNDGEISVHQINFLLQRSNVRPEQVQAATKQILERLIEQELLVQKATEKKLDRDPLVMQAVEAARREILARAYAERIGSGVDKPAESEVKEYYGKHPELFAQRRVYSLREVAVVGDTGVQQRVREQLAKAKSLEDMLGWMKAESIPYRANGTTKAAEQLPIEMLGKLAEMKDGQIGVMSAPNGMSIIQVAASRLEPVNETQATPMIERFLANQRRGTAMQQEMKQVRDSAKIEYMGEFAAVAQAQAGSEPLAIPSAVPGSDAASAPAAAEAGEIEKGIAAGIK